MRALGFECCHFGLKKSNNPIIYLPSVVERLTVLTGPIFIIEATPLTPVSTSAMFGILINFNKLTVDIKIYCLLQFIIDINFYDPFTSRIILIKVNI